MDREFEEVFGVLLIVVLGLVEDSDGFEEYDLDDEDCNLLAGWGIV